MPGWTCDRLFVGEWESVPFEKDAAAVGQGARYDGRSPQRVGRVMSSVEILAQRFERIIPHKRGSRSGVYVLLDRGEAIYVGSTVYIDMRVDEHLTGTDTNASRKIFDSVLWLPLPIETAIAYEGALIRALRPRLNLQAPSDWRNDNAILGELGLPEHPDPKKNWIDWKASTRRRKQPRSDVGKKHGRSAA